MDVFSNPTENRSRWFWRLALLAFILALVMGVLLWRNLGIASITDIQARVKGLKPALTAIRLLLIGLVGGFWPAIVDKLHQSGRIDASGKAQLLAQRWRVLIWLVLLELMLGQNLPGHFLQALRGIEA